MDAVQSFILEKTGTQKALLNYFHQMLLGQPGVVSKIRYKIPFYYRKSWICYLNPVEGEAIELAFLRGNELSNAQGLLDFRGRKQVAGIIFYQISEVAEEVLMEIVQEALLLDEKVAYASKRKPHNS